MGERHGTRAANAKSSVYNSEHRVFVVYLQQGPDGGLAIHTVSGAWADSVTRCAAVSVELFIYYISGSFDQLKTFDASKMYFCNSHRQLLAVIDTCISCPV